MEKKIQRVTVQEGYDLWAETYDTTPNPVVAMDARHTLSMLAPQPGERILDAGCGTGRNLKSVISAGSRAVGLDFSHGMLKVAQRRLPRVPLLRADLQRQFPFQRECFDAVLCALIGEHLDDLRTTFSETHAVLRRGGRFVFSVYHPELAAAGKEANFQRDGIEYRLGAVRYTVDDYLNLLEDAGFRQFAYREFNGDEELARQVPAAERLLNVPVLFAVEARKN
ncbi:MAG TPA: class I SAM-dependent methyltransferase [Blastocatellia bacterium]|nr:class I SAM-dependent methyltransferase [Blastocatellia bacterium]